MNRNSRQSDDENIKNRQEKQELEERIRFEKLLCTLAATFVNLPSDAIDKGIEHGLELIVRFLGADRGVVLQFSEDGRTLKVSHSYIAPNGKPLPSTTITEGQRHLWYTEALRNEEMVVLENLPDDLPKEALVERRFCIEQGLKSHLCIPLSMGKALPKGAIGFGYMHGRRTWPMQWLQRVRFVGHTLTFALMRKQTEKELHEALAEITELKKRLEAEIVEEIKVEYSYGEILGHSNAIKTIMSQVEQVAHTDSTVLIQGETGTGKELLARAIHRLSPRNGKVMVKINCAAIPPTLIKATALGLLARRKNVRVLVDAACSGNKAAAKIALQQIRAKGAKLLDTQTLLGSSALHLARKQSYPNF